MDKGAANFEPTERQQRTLAAFQEGGYADTVLEACRAAGVDAGNYYRWFDKPGFAAWWQAEAEAWFGRQLPRVQAAMLRAAGGEEMPGSPDRKLFLERYDRKYAPRSKQELDLGDRAGAVLEALLAKAGEK